MGCGLACRYVVYGIFAPIREILADLQQKKGVEETIMSGMFSAISAITSKIMSKSK